MVFKFKKRKGYKKLKGHRQQLTKVRITAVGADKYEAPAKAAKLNDVGSIEVGKCADLVVLDHDLNLVAVFVDGEKVFG